MAVSAKDMKPGTLVLVAIVGILIGSYLTMLVGMIPGSSNVVRTFFTYPIINFGAGFPHPLMVDLWAVKFQIGLQLKFSLLSVLGVALSLYFFRWYK